MSRLDYRKTEAVVCAGLSITTFLSDCRNFIMVSASDLIDELGLNVHIDDIGVEEYATYDIIGRQHMHYAIPHTEVNDLLFMYDCSPTNVDNLIEFRKFFMYEVITFWNRFEPAAASLSVRDAVRLIDKRTGEYHDKLGLPPGRILQFASDALGYDKVPNKEFTTTEELSFMAFAELLYASVAAAEQANGASVQESMRIADMRLERPLKDLGNVTRGVSGI